MDRDGHVGAPPAIELTVNRPDRRGWERFELPGTVEALQQLASGLLAGRGFTEAAWTGRGRPYTKTEFHELRDKLLEQGFLQWRNERARAQGVELTQDGEDAFEQLLQNARTHAHARRGELLDSPAHTGAE